MERMSILDNYYGEGKSIRDKIAELEEENRNLKKEKGKIRQRLIALEKKLETLSRVKENKELREENKKLKSDLEQFSEAYKRYRDFEKEELAESCYDLEKENKNLNEKVRFLEECLDKKEKVNKSLREELGWYKTEHERLVDKLVIKGATELLDRKFENKKGWQGE